MLATRKIRKKNEKMEKQKQNPENNQTTLLIFFWVSLSFFSSLYFLSLLPTLI